MVQMGRIMKAKALHQDRADLITMNATKKMTEAQESFHNTLDEVEIEIVSCDLSPVAPRRVLYLTNGTDACQGGPPTRPRATSCKEASIPAGGGAGSGSATRAHGHRSGSSQAFRTSSARRPHDGHWRVTIRCQSWPAEDRGQAGCALSRHGHGHRRPPPRCQPY